MIIVLNEEEGYERGGGGGTRLLFAVFTHLTMAVNAWSFCWLFIDPLVTCPFLFVLTWPYQNV